MLKFMEICHWAFHSLFWGGICAEGLGGVLFFT